jgi:hypothetical protein
MIPLAAMLSSCDPGVNLAWQGTLKGQVDRRCIAAAVKSVTGRIELSTYVSEGSPFPRGLTVQQIWYKQQFNEKMAYVSSGYRIDLAALPDGSVGYYHGWGKLGTDIPPAERDYVIPVMTRVNAAVAKRCGVSFGSGPPSQGTG